MWVVRAKRNILGNLVTLVLLSILAGVVSGGVIGIAMQPKIHVIMGRPVSH